uniref:Uncharacterized protein n=1 Tax=Anguilla anguilla TaxID=7936 RepID=A0A0E9R7Y2_ANGAN
MSHGYYSKQLWHQSDATMASCSHEKISLFCLLHFIACPAFS